MTNTVIIDGGVYKRGATYTGKGQIDANCLNDGGVGNHFTCDFTTTTATNDIFQLNLGFQPRHIEVLNETDGIFWEQMIGMAAANSVKFTFSGPTMAIDTSSQITVSTDYSGNYIVTLGTTLTGQAKHLVVSIEG